MVKDLCMSAVCSDSAETGRVRKGCRAFAFSALKALETCNYFLTTIKEQSARVCVRTKYTHRCKRKLCFSYAYPSQYLCKVCKGFKRTFQIAVEEDKTMRAHSVLFE